MGEDFSILGIIYGYCTDIGKYCPKFGLLNIAPSLDIDSNVDNFAVISAIIVPLFNINIQMKPQHYLYQGGNSFILLHLLVLWTPKLQLIKARLSLPKLYPRTHHHGRTPYMPL